MKKVFMIFLLLLYMLYLWGCDSTNNNITKKMIVAIDSKNYEMVETIAKKSNFDINQRPYGINAFSIILEQWNLPPLHYACLRHDFEAVKIMIENGADVNLIIDGKTPLMYCLFVNSIRHCTSIIDFLVQNGANISIKDQYNKSILDYIFLGSYDESLEIIQFEYFIKFSNIDSSLVYKELKNKSSLGSGSYLHKAVYFNNALIIDYLINNMDFDVDQLNNDNETSLMISAKYNNYEAAKVLIDNCANINLTNNDGDDAITLAEKSGDEKLINMLLEYKNK